jgi:hypothetical protein
MKILPQVLNITLVPCHQIVKAKNAIAIPDKSIAQMAPDKTCTARDQYCFLLHRINLL